MKKVIAIDGFGGSGKSKLVDNLIKSDFFKEAVGVFNSGNYARAIAHEMIKSNLTVNDPNFKMAAIKARDKIDFTKERAEFYTSEVENTIPDIVAIPEIKNGFSEKLPDIIESFGEDIIIVIGRVIGSLYPQAVVKLYLETSPDICAHRRAYERSLKGEDYAAVLENQKKRNQADKSNWEASNPRPEDTIIVNTDFSTEKDVLWKTLHHLNKIF